MVRAKRRISGSKALGQEFDFLANVSAQNKRSNF